MVSLKQGGQTLLYIITSLVLAITVTIFISPWIYELSITWFDLDAMSGLSPDQLMENYQVIIAYLVNPTVSTLNMPYFSSSPQGLIHFADVKILFMVLFAADIIFVLLSTYVIRQKRLKYEKKQLKTWFNLAISFPLILLFVIIVAFDQLFVLFHQLLFSNDYWLFDPNIDPVITVLPEPFFMILFVVALLIYEIIVLIIRWLVTVR